MSDGLASAANWLMCGLQQVLVLFVEMTEFHSKAPILLVCLRNAGGFGTAVVYEGRPGLIEGRLGELDAAVEIDNCGNAVAVVPVDATPAVAVETAAATSVVPSVLGVEVIARVSVSAVIDTVAPDVAVFDVVEIVAVEVVAMAVLNVAVVILAAAEVNDVAAMAVDASVVASVAVVDVTKVLDDDVVTFAAAALVVATHFGAWEHFLEQR